nr:HAMP domain-containing sensor histidine kinase [Desulforamulus aquiferis]
MWAFVEDFLFGLALKAVFVAFTVVQGKLLLKRLNNGQSDKEWQTSLLFKLFQSIKEAFLIRSIGIQLLILLMIVFAFGVGAVAVLMEPRFILVYFPLFLLIGIPAIFFMVRRIGYFNRIVTHSNDLVRGDLRSDIQVVGKSALANLAQSINTLRHGVQASQREQAKSERLKTELITNVSHDLRTPLTSIITYTELLKSPGLAEDERNSYIEIIDRKSKRLKVLIDDLFEASKMASGNIELVKEKVDLVQLLQQALAEHDETIRSSTLQFRVSNPEKALYAIVDGQKLWRVFDNLIGNILKYSLENTRYISQLNPKAATPSFHSKMWLSTSLEKI